MSRACLHGGRHRADLAGALRDGCRPRAAGWVSESHRAL